MDLVSQQPADPSPRLEAVTYKCRRQVLRILETAGEPLSLADIAIELVRRETNHEAVGTERERVEELRMALHHQHIPKLATAGLLTYNPDHNSAALTEAGAEMIGHLDRMTLMAE